ncbi:hypothetical protein L2E82_11628 [Cichorium intybus]|uniref:Uncharacterized protein n=1 Tax=Cichorium intybus TaxID=13427 RepID=A0ACB9GF00_CICIN|nr:hypothetical protein L2E82_11628 [Cichorium intybus]
MKSHMFRGIMFDINKSCKVLVCFIKLITIINTFISLYWGFLLSYRFRPINAVNMQLEPTNHGIFRVQMVVN